MSVLPPVISQIGYPGAGDIDDCWVVATVWAEQASRPGSFKPTVPQFRAKANKPDAPGPTGGNIQNVYAGAVGSWPDLRITLYISAEVEPLLAAVKAGQPASIALDSSDLPARLRFGFLGKHQCGLAWDGSRYVLMNPLALNGSPLLPITTSEIARAMLGLLTQAQSHYRFRAVLFPKQLGTKWQATIHPKPGDPDGKQPFLVYRVRDHDDRPLQIVRHETTQTGGSTYDVNPPVKCVRGPGFPKDAYLPKALCRLVDAVPHLPGGGYLDIALCEEV